MRGEYAGFEGKITQVDRKRYTVFVEGVTREKVDGTPVPVPIHPSKVVITQLDLGDRWRREKLERIAAGTAQERTPVAAVKPKKEEDEAR